MIASVVLPTFNEKGNIVSLVKKIMKCLKGYEFEIIIVDDNSPDGTSDCCRKVFKNNKNVRVFVRKNSRGLATAIHFGIKKAKGKYVIVMDTDLSHDPKLIPIMLSKASRFNLIIGSRYINGGGMDNRKRYWLSKFYNLYLRFLLRIPVTDFLSGFFCMERSILISILRKRNNIFTGYGEYFIKLIYIINKIGGKFCEIPSFYKNRQYGESKTKFLNIFIVYTKTSVGLLRKGISE